MRMEAKETAYLIMAFAEGLAGLMPSGVGREAQDFSLRYVGLVGFAVEIEAAGDHAPIEFNQLEDQSIAAAGRDSVERDADSNFSEMKVDPKTWNPIAHTNGVHLDSGERPGKLHWQ